MKTYSTGDLIDSRFFVIEEIGGGGFGKVLKVQSLLEPSEHLALKYCKSDDEQYIRRFQREVRIMRSIKNENVIDVIYSNTEYDPPYFVMPLAKESLAEIIPRDLIGNLDQTISVFSNICKGITVIHASGYTHRDIKPENILCFDNESIVISDLGLAKPDVRDTTVLTSLNIAIGTEGYSPPEVYMHGGTQGMDQRGDIYMLGKTLYKMLTNLNPMVMDQKAVPIGMWFVIKKATQQDPENRYQTVGELLDAVLNVQRALSADLNPEKTFLNLLESARAYLQAGEYDEENVLNMLRTLSAVEDSEAYLNLFASIPIELINVYSTNFSIEFEPIVERYCEKIKDTVWSMPFPYADTVYRLMTITFENTKSLELKRFAILSILHAALGLNRFAAKDRFDKLLMSISIDDEAFAIADGLRDDLPSYKEMYQRIPKKELHPAIQLVWEQCEVEEQAEEF